MEFAGPAPLGPFASLAADMPFRRTNDVKKVQPGAQAGDTTGHAGQKPGHDARAAEARDIRALRREMERRDLPAGPPPSFQVSLLEVESDLQQVIARIEAARNQARQADALKADAQHEARAAEAEMAEITEAAPRREADAAERASGDQTMPAGSEPAAVPAPAAVQTSLFTSV